MIPELAAYLDTHLPEHLRKYREEIDYIVHTVYYKQVLGRLNKFDFVPLNSALLNEQLGSYREGNSGKPVWGVLKRWLTKTDANGEPYNEDGTAVVLKLDARYKPGVGSQGYLLDDRWRQYAAKRQAVHCPRLLKKLAKHKEAPELTYSVHKKLVKYHGRLSVDWQEAEAYLQELEQSGAEAKAVHDARASLELVDRCDDAAYRVDDHGRRFYSPFTNLKRTLRRFVLLDGKPLLQVDIACSQPLFVGMLIMMYQATEGNLMAYDALLSQDDKDPYLGLQERLDQILSCPNYGVDPTTLEYSPPSSLSVRGSSPSRCPFSSIGSSLSLLNQDPSDSPTLNMSDDSSGGCLKYKIKDQVLDINPDGYWGYDKKNAEIRKDLVISDRFPYLTTNQVRYLQAVESNRLYDGVGEWLSTGLDGYGSFDRGTAKVETQRYLHSSPRQQATIANGNYRNSRPCVIQYFRDNYPDVHSILDKVKRRNPEQPKDNPKGKKYTGSNDVHRRITHVEATFIFNYVCRRIIETYGDSVPIVTIHDSIAAPYDVILVVWKTMHDAFAKFNLYPNVEIQPIDK